MFIIEADVYYIFTAASPKQHLAIV